jgi:predicted Zn finger-like uncharacterized protein
MALATVCPHCNTTFRVASDQLKLRGGIVRCGACNEVFDGNAALIDLDAVAPPPPAAPPASDTSDTPSEPVADSTPPDLPASEAVPEPDAPAALESVIEPEIVTEPDSVIEPDSLAEAEPPASASHDAEEVHIDARQEEIAEEPVYTLDFDTTFDPFGVLPKPEPASEAAEAEPVPESEAVPEQEGEATLEQLVDEEIIALPPPDDEPGLAGDAPELPTEPARDEPDLLASLLMRQSAAAEPFTAAAPDTAPAVTKPGRRNAKRHKPAPTPVVAAEPEPEPAPQDDEPDFVRRIRQQEQTFRTRRLVMAAASALLVLALAAQAMTTFRSVLAARYPALKPVIAATCAVFGCKVELPAQIDMLSVETGELQTLDAATFSYTTLLRNPGELVQAWPHIELTLTDANDKPVVRRVFTPAQYLPAGVAPAKGFAPRSEQAVKLTFELNQIKASGYHIAIFYP